MMTTSRFPNSPKNGDIHIDNNNVEWMFSGTRNSWVKRRVIEETPIVSADNDGLVTPEIYNKLVKLQETANNINLDIFKIYPGTDAYYYYFYSPDGLIDVRHLGDGILSIDVNEQKLIAYLYRFLCQGDRGPRGEKGIKGDHGYPAPPEQDFIATVDDGVVKGQVYVPMPIGNYYEHETVTPINLRFYGLYDPSSTVAGSDQLSYWSTIILNPLINDVEKDTLARLRQAMLDQAIGNYTGELIDLSQIVTRLSPINPGAMLNIDIHTTTGEINVISNGIGVEYEDIIALFDPTIGLLRFEIKGQWPDTTTFRARQRGPKGTRGDIPNNYIHEVECKFPDDANVRPNQTLTHLRVDCDDRVFHAGYSRLDSQDAYQLVSTSVDAAVAHSEPPINGRYVAVEKIAGSVKRVVQLDNSLPSIDVDNPNLINWEPQPGCHTRRSFNKHKFDWIAKTDVPKCDIASGLTWYGPGEVRPGKYPHDIVTPSIPKGEQCCQEDFFYFPESGDC